MTAGCANHMYEHMYNMKSFESMFTFPDLQFIVMFKRYQYKKIVDVA